MELLLSGNTIDATEAKNLGLLNIITANESLITKSIEILNKILENSPLAITSIINAVNAFFSHNINGFESEIKEFEKCFGSNDFIEGTDAFISKRKPNFNG